MPCTKNIRTGTDHDFRAREENLVKELEGDDQRDRSDISEAKHIKDSVKR